MSKKYKILLLLILFLSLVLRLLGIRHGFPFIFHPDEPAVIRTALGIRFDMNPGHFDWPHLFMYLNYFVYMIFARIRTLLGSSSLSVYIPDIVRNDDLIFYLLSRIFAAILGGFTVIPIFLSAKRLFEDRTGILASLVFAFIPFHVWHSHYALIDIPMVFFLAWSIYFATGIIVRNRLSDFLLSGLFLGFSASTKYNGALGVIFIIIATLLHILGLENKRSELTNSTKRLVLSGLASIFGFVLGTPYSVFDYKTFIRTDGPQGALWQFTNVGKVNLYDQFTQFIQACFGDFPVNLGVTFWLLFIGGFIYVIFNLRKNAKNVYAFCFFIVALFLLFYVSGLEKTRAHYFMIAYPFFTLAVGYVFGLVFGTIRNVKLEIIFVTLVILAPLAASLNNAFIFVRKDTRVELYEWFERYSDERDFIVYDGEDLAAVMESGLVSGEINKSSKVKVQDVVYKNGYMIVSDNSSATVMIDGETTDLSSEPIEIIYSEGRRGPDIRVYKLPVINVEVD